MIKKWFEIILDHRISMRERMFRIVTLVCMIALVFTLPMGRRLLNIAILLASLLAMAAIVKISIRKGRVEAGATAIVVLMLALFQLDPAEYATLLPKSITTAIGKGLSEELGGYPAITMVTIMITGLFGAVAAPALLRLMRVTEPLAQGLAIGTSSHAAGTSRAVELGDVQGAASSLAIVVTGLLTVIAAPLFAMLA